jgi:hypothetical protein
VRLRLSQARPVPLGSLHRAPFPKPSPPRRDGRVCATQRGTPAGRPQSPQCQRTRFLMNFPARARSRGRRAPRPRAPSRAPRPGCRGTVASPARAPPRLPLLLARPDPGAARRSPRSWRRRRCFHRCRRRSGPKLQPRGSQAAAGGAVAGTFGSAGSRSSRPTASPCPGPARTRAGSPLLAAQRWGSTEPPGWAGIPSLG